MHIQQLLHCEHILVFLVFFYCLQNVKYRFTNCIFFNHLFTYLHFTSLSSSVSWSLRA